MQYCDNCNIATAVVLRLMQYCEGCDIASVAMPRPLQYCTCYNTGNCGGAAIGCNIEIGHSAATCCNTANAALLPLIQYCDCCGTRTAALHQRDGSKLVDNDDGCAAWLPSANIYVANLVPNRHRDRRRPRLHHDRAGSEGRAGQSATACPGSIDAATTNNPKCLQ